MIRFIHTADIHFGMENYGKIDSTLGIHSRLLDFERALNQCIDYAIKHQVDFFLFAGDAYKTASPSPTQQQLLLQCFLRLHAAKIPVIIVVGNHDHPVSFGKAHSLDIFKQLPIDGFHVIAKPKIVTIKTKSGPINIVGIPWPNRSTLALSDRLCVSNIEISRHLSETVSKLVTHFAQKLDPQIPAVLTGHLTVASGVFSGSEKRAIYGTDPLILVSQLAIAPFDYVALGHLHRYQNLNPHGYPAVVYSGSIERIDFGERNENKGFCDVIINQKGETTHTFIELATRPFVQLDVHIDQEKDQTQQLIDHIKSHPITNAIVKILYHLPPGVKDLVDIRTVQRACVNAWHLVSITPIHTHVPRERRSSLKASMDLPTLLQRYFETKPELDKQKASLIQKALDLVHEAQDTTEI